MSSHGLLSIAARDVGPPPRDLAIDDPASRSVLGDWYEERGIEARAVLESIGRIAAIMERKRGVDVHSVEYRQLSNENTEIHDRLTAELASARGWIVAKSSFTFDELVTGRRSESGPFRRRPIQPEGRLIDHPERFREPARPYQPAAILSHSYNTDREPFEKLAAETGLAVEFLPWSWYYPGHCLAALFTRPPSWEQLPSRSERRRQRLHPPR